MMVVDQIRNILLQNLDIELLDVIDESHLHYGHAGMREGGQSHFAIKIISESFADLNQITRQRKIYTLLKPLLAEQIHALRLETLTPLEAKSKY